jgi:MOSC domain-containing protein YiiM
VQASLKQLMDQFAQNGVVEWIGIRTMKKTDLVTMGSVLLDPSSGLEGDHYAGKSGKRQVTLIQAEHLPVIASMMQMEQVTPEQLRRNIVISGLNLLALKDKTFQLGEAVLEFTGLCHPCSRMETTLGIGGYNAMRGHGGITASVIQSGRVTVGDQCSVILES